MKKADLAAMTVSELRVLARKLKVAVPGSAKKPDIVKALLAAAPAARSAGKAGRPPAAGAAQKASAKPAKRTAKKTEKKAARPSARKTTAPPSPAQERPQGRWELPPGLEEPLMAQERIERAKYYTGPERSAGKAGTYAELPSEYGEDQIVMLARDPSVAFAYWEVTPARLAREKEWFGWDSTLCIRIYDVTGIHFDGSNAAAYYDQEIQQRFGSWYFHIGRPGHSFVADIGLRAPNGRFLVLARSNSLRLPTEGPAEETDEAWAVSEEEFREMYGFPEGMSSEEVREFWRLRRMHGIMSPGMQAGRGGKGRYQA